MNGKDTDVRSHIKDQIRDDCHEQVCAGQTADKRNVKDLQWSSEDPFQVLRPEDLPRDLLVRVRDVLVFLVDENVSPGDALAGGHGQVDEEGNGGDGCDKDMEEAFFLCVAVSSPLAANYEPWF